MHTTLIHYRITKRQIRLNKLEVVSMKHMVICVIGHSKICLKRKAFRDVILRGQKP